MLNLKNVAAAGALLAATVAAPFCGAQTVKVLTAGSSAQWGVFAESAFALAGTESVGVGATTVHHCTLSTSQTFLHDNRGAGVPNEPGKTWIVWTQGVDSMGGTVYGGVSAYESEDSVVGVREFYATPRGNIATTGGPSSTPTCQNSLSTGAALFPNNDDSVLPAAVNAAVTTNALTAANTDIRPEDALFATTRAINALNTSDWSGLGIGSGGVVSDSLGMVAHVEVFNLSGTDPLTNSAIPTDIQTIPIGAAPVIFLANTSNTGTGHLGDPSITLNVNNGFAGANDALTIFSGVNCDASLVGGGLGIGVSAVLREPTSGTMNTTEYTNFRTSLNGRTASQEAGATYPSMNLQGCTSGTGTRTRAVGTGDEVSLVKSLTDGLGYAFYSVEAVPNGPPAGGVTAYKYLTLNGQDPLFPATSSGVLPVCGANNAYFCTASPVSGPDFSNVYDSFDSLRTGNYDSWSVYRIVTDSTGATAVNSLVAVSQGVVDEELPDFVPVQVACTGDTLPGGVTLTNPAGGGTTTQFSADEPGLEVFRSHYNRSGLAPANGAVVSTTRVCGSDPARTYNAAFVGGSTEAGGDVGGRIINVMNNAPSAAQIARVNRIQ